ncbi:hypothetical protein NQZ68_009136 [Dissostichus eleginoides]|nr:hypothetical protein NQZ68_009136 [Dissostichus eleginoides]
MERRSRSEGPRQWSELCWGLSGAERRPQPQGTLTQRAMDMEALFRLNCGLLTAGAMLRHCAVGMPAKPNPARADWDG